MWKAQPLLITILDKDYWISAKLSRYITDLENT